MLHLVERILALVSAWLSSSRVRCFPSLRALLIALRLGYNPNYPPLPLPPPLQDRPWRSPTVNLPCSGSSTPSASASGCFGPLTVKPRLSKELGTRHRAAIGVTEETDAVAIIVSEETGAISFAHDGEMDRYLDPETLRLRLRDAFERKAVAPTPRAMVEPAEHRVD